MAHAGDYERWISDLLDSLPDKASFFKAEEIVFIDHVSMRPVNYGYTLSERKRISDLHERLSSYNECSRYTDLLTEM